MIKEKERLAHLHQESEREKELKRLQQKYILREQIKEKEQLGEEAKQQYEREKEQVNKVIQNLINEDRR